MATVNLGRIKPVFRGAYNNSTAYVIDDIVTSGNETFIAIAATTGNATSDASKWTKLAAKGADGADGTDVAATLANKEISFKTNAGALDGIPIGNAGEFLKVNSGATGYEFGAVSSDWVKITTSTISSAVSDVSIDNIFSATYKNYVIIGTQVKGSNQDTNMRMRFLDGSGNQLTGSHYRGHSGGTESNSGSGNNAQHNGYSDQDIAQLRPAGNVTDNVRGGFNFTMHIPDPFSNTTSIVYFTYGCVRNNGNSLSGHGMMYYNSNSVARGMKFDYESGNVASGTITVYGIKS